MNNTLVSKGVRINDRVRIYVGGTDLNDYSVLFTGRYRHLTENKFVLLHMFDDLNGPRSMHTDREEDYHLMVFDHQCDTLGDGGVPIRWGGVSMGRRCHLGKRIPFEKLPRHCQEKVLAEYDKIWGDPMQYS